MDATLDGDFAYSDTLSQPLGKTSKLQGNNFFQAMNFCFLYFKKLKATI